MHLYVMVVTEQEGNPSDLHDGPVFRLERKGWVFLGEENWSSRRIVLPCHTIPLGRVVEGNKTKTYYLGK